MPLAGFLVGFCRIPGGAGRFCPVETMQLSDFLDALSGFLDDLCSTPGGASRFSPAVIAVRDNLCGVERAVARVGGGGATFAVAGVPVGSGSVLCCLNLRAAWRRSSKLSVVAFVGRTRF